MAEIDKVAREGIDIARRAAPGPWRWLEDEENARRSTKTADGKLKPLPGHHIRETYLYCLVGGPKGNYTPTDRFDYHQIAALRWWDIKGDTVMNARPERANAALIAHAGTHYRDLCAAVIERGEEIERLRARVAELEGVHG